MPNLRTSLCMVSGPGALPRLRNVGAWSFTSFKKKPTRFVLDHEFECAMDGRYQALVSKYGNLRSQPRALYDFHPAVSTRENSAGYEVIHLSDLRETIFQESVVAKVFLC